MVQCPKCMGEMVLNRGGLFCDECGIKIWRRVAGKSLTDRDLERIAAGETVRVKGLRSRAGKKFSAGLRLNLEENRVEFVFRNAGAKDEAHAEGEKGKDREG